MKYLWLTAAHILVIKKTIADYESRKLQRWRMAIESVNILKSFQNLKI